MASDDLPAWELHRRKVEAGALKVNHGTYFALQSAALVHGLPVRIDRSLPVQVFRTMGGRHTRNRLLEATPALLGEDDLTVVDGLPATSLRRTVVDLIRRLPFPEAVAVVDAAGQPHGAGLFVWDATDYYYLLSTRDPERAVLGAVDYLVWLGIVDAMQRGLRFDFDGVSSPSRLHFLQAFGGRLGARFVVTRRSGLYDVRVLLRRLRHRARHGELPEFP